MHTKLVAVNGKISFPVRLYHWWPGRTWQGPCPIPESLIDQALAMGSRYLTCARVPAEEWGLSTVAFCCPRDVPDRSIGRAIAVGRMAKALESIGWTLEERPTAS